MAAQSDMDSTGRFCAVRERPVYDGTEFGVSQLDLMLPDGDVLSWDMVRLGQSAWVVLADTGGRVLLVRRYRPGLDRWGWELPGKDPSQTAARELEFRNGKVQRIRSLQNQRSFGFRIVPRQR